MKNHKIIPHHHIQESMKEGTQAKPASIPARSMFGNRPSDGAYGAASAGVPMSQIKSGSQAPTNGTGAGTKGWKQLK